MLGIGVLGAGRAAYYLDSVAQGREDYYLGAGEAPGRWLGQQADTLELSDIVDAADLFAVLAGLDPQSGHRLDRARNNRVPGFDLTFSAPKSVSILFALADPTVAEQVRDAHDSAVTETLGWLEREACVVRRGAGGVRELRGDGFVAAAFRHRTSRAGDPHLHTHVLVANLTRGGDGTWSALDGRHLFALAKTAGHLYRAHLRHELTHQLGLEWELSSNGLSDLAGIPRALIDDLSQRRAQIVERLDALGLTSARAAQIATLDTRTPKDADLDVEELRIDWQEIAADHGVEREALGALIDRVTPKPLDPDHVTSIEGELLGSAGLTARSATFDRRQVLQAWCSALRHGAPIGEIEALGECTLTNAEVVPLEGTPANVGMHRTDRRRIDPPSIGHRYTTDEMLTLELRLVRGAYWRASERVGLAERWALEHALASRPTLGDDQRAMIVVLTTGGRGVDVVVAPAGSGKTYALAAARAAWEASGHRVVGCAVAARAAQQLQDATGIPTMTVARLTYQLAQHERFPPGTVLVVDEAAMAGTRTLAPLLDAAERDHAKVVLVGDYRQLPEIDAGGLVRGLDHHLGAVRLQRNRRQREPWEQNALTALRLGRTDAAIGAYERHDRVAVDTTASNRRTRMVADFVEAHKRGEQVVMLATRWRDVHDLNRRARQHLASEGYLDGPALTIAHCEYQVGDRVMTLRNARRVGVTNGTIGVITQLDVHARTVTITTPDDERAILPSDYLDAGGIVHAYATTIHKAQGVTVDRALVLASDDLSRERGYTALSRGRLENRLYLVTPQMEQDHHHLDRRDPIVSLEAALHRSEAQELAMDHGVEIELP